MKKLIILTMVLVAALVYSAPLTYGGKNLYQTLVSAGGSQVSSSRFVLNFAVGEPVVGESEVGLKSVLAGFFGGGSGAFNKFIWSEITSMNNNDTIIFLEDVSGTASSSNINHSVSAVGLIVKDISTGNYWNGSSWVASETELSCTGTSVWKYTFENIELKDGNTYEFQSIARDMNNYPEEGPDSQDTVKVEFSYQNPNKIFVVYPSPYNPEEGELDITFFATAEFFGNSESYGLSAYDMKGIMVRKFVEADYYEGPKKGQNKVRWDGKNGNGSMVKAGIYYFVLKDQKRKLVTKIKVVR